MSSPSRTPSPRSQDDHFRLVERISHEIRTPMFGVIGSAELLEKTELNDEQRTYIGTITQSANALMEIVDAILDISRIEDGTLTFSPKECDLYAVINEIVQEYTPQTHRARVEVMISYGCDVPRMVYADTARVRQICVNLVANAIQFTQQGYIYIQIHQTADGEIEIKFRDTGQGIPELDQHVLLDMYSGNSRDMDDRAQGSGLGIAISRQLVELMNGTFTLHSSAEGTTEFCVQLPLPPCDDQPTVPPPPSLTGHSILLVHSIPEVQDIYSQWLTQLGAECTAVDTADAALATLEKDEYAETFDTLVVNEHLSDMHGETMAWALRQSPHHSEVTFALLTLSGNDVDFERMRCVGISSLIVKPVSPLSLARGILIDTDDSLPIFTTAPPPHDDHTTAPVAARALIVEDNAINRKVAMALLQKMGCIVEYAENGRECLEMLTSQSYDIIFMDCRMPVMDGYDTTRHIRANEDATSHVPIVAVTANVVEGDREKCLDAGMDDYIPKPIRAIDIQTVLHRWVGDL